MLSREKVDSDFLVRYLYEGNLKVAYLDEYIVRMRMGRRAVKEKLIDELGGLSDALAWLYKEIEREQ